tara:strand:+ start:159 stop:542 length:384 start_codon:yes stop_codon:yes gene_type:complete
MEDKKFKSVKQIINENQMNKKEYWENEMRNDTKTDLFKLINTLDNADDINLVKEMLMTRSKSLAKKTKLGLMVGDEVIISGSNRINSGKIIKINRTKAIINCYDKTIKDMVTYHVPFSMIRKVVNNG